MNHEGLDSARVGANSFSFVPFMSSNESWVRRGTRLIRVSMSDHSKGTQTEKAKENLEESVEMSENNDPEEGTSGVIPDMYLNPTGQVAQENGSTGRIGWIRISEFGEDVVGDGSNNDDEERDHEEEQTKKFLMATADASATDSWLL